MSKCHVSLVLKIRWAEVDPLGHCLICCCVHFQFLLWRLGKFWAKIWGRGVEDDLSEKCLTRFLRSHSFFSGVLVFAGQKARAEGLGVKISVKNLGVGRGDSESLGIF